ncbi:MAG: pentapeptide repeat-containing protein, partial [Cyanobacteria bacterium J06643_5]
MKTQVIAAAAALSTMFLGATAQAEKPVSKEILELTETRECYACNLRGANLRGVHLIGVDLRNANLRGA